MQAMLRSPLPYMLILVLLACAPRPRPKPSLPRFYDRLQEPLDTLDVGSVAGRKIVIDPGHGGVFRGAVGLNGLDEADVNLGVALYLWGLLDEAGAHVHLTRKTDRDFVEGDSLALREDLEARAAVVRRTEPDVFVSIHHNADFAGDRNFNEIQVYYKIGDDGPSLDIARIVARHLRGNIGETATRVLPGNYYVLRNSEVPAILCEPSYISNPRIESRLRLADSQRLEAEVYFLALVDYFSRGVPRVKSLSPDGRVTTARPRIDVVFDRESVIDPAAVSIRLNGTRLSPFRLGPNAFAAFPPEPLRGGHHSVKAAGRAVGGNASPEAASVFEVDLRPEVVKLRALPEACSRPYPQKITALVVDVHANPVKDGTEVKFGWEAGSRMEKTIGGEASVFVGREIPFGVSEVTAACGDIVTEIGPDTSADSRCVSGFVVSAGGSPIEGAAVTAPDVRFSAITDRYGFFALPSGGRPGSLDISKSGYRRAPIEIDADAYPVIQLDRFYSGFEVGLTVAIDPQGGGSETGWVGPTGIAASDLNLEVATRVVSTLKSAGVDAHLTRETDSETGGSERVAACESRNSALLVSITHMPASTEEVAVEHFPGSRGGALLSRYLADEIGSARGYGTRIGETAEYIIQQTSCPAVRVVFPAGETAQDEVELARTFSIWRRAYPICCAVLRYLGVDDGSTFAVSGNVMSDGRPSGHAVVSIDGTLDVLAGPDGRFTVKLLEDVPHTAQAFASARRSQPVTFGKTTGSVTLELAQDPHN